MKTIRRIILFIMVIVMMPSAFGAVVHAGEYSILIDDEADLLTDEEEAELLDSMTPLLEYGNAAFTTVRLSQSTDYEDNAEDTYYDHFGNEPGVLFQIDMGNRKLTLSASTDMEDLIGSERDSIVDNIYTMATDGDYLGCAQECFDEIYAVLNDGKIAHKMKYIDNAILALILAILLNFAFVFLPAGRKASRKALIKGMVVPAATVAATVTLGRLIKEYSPVSHSGGGGSSGGGGGGGFSGGSSSHGF